MSPSSFPGLNCFLGYAHICSKNTLRHSCFHSDVPDFCTGMTQSVFAAYMGVSKKTVEAWEGGRTHPSGPAFRLLEVLASDNPERTNYVVVK